MMDGYLEKGDFFELYSLLGGKKLAGEKVSLLFKSTVLTLTKLKYLKKR